MSYLNGLNERQKEAVLHTEGPLLIIAGAGAGKTKTVTHRIAHLIEGGVPGRSILAITFTNKAATELRERLYRLLPHAQGGMPLATTFHALGARLLREFHAEAGLPRAFTIWDRDDSMRAIKKIAERLDITEPAPRAILSGLSRRKGEGLTAREFETAASNFRERTIAQVWRAYEDILHEEGALDFDDLLLKVLSLLRTNTDVLSKLRARWHYLTVDEYQDTNTAQYEIVRLLAGESRNICVVGDGDQNIYSWRGAQMEHLLQFEEHYPGAKVVLLEQNYRSTRTILAAANGVIAKNRNRRDKNLFTDNDTGEPVHIYDARNDIDEAWFVAQNTALLIEEGTRPGEIAILYRENFQSRALEEALLAHGIPYRVLGVRFFERAEVKDVLSYLRAAMNPKARQDMTRIVAVPPRGIGKVTLEKILAGETLTGATGAKVSAFQTSLAKIAHAARTLPCSEAVRFTAEESGLEAMFKEDSERGTERSANVRELVNLAVRYDSEESPTGLERLLEEAALQSEQDSLGNTEERAGVSLMTVHASKGLEFDAVFITGLEQGLFPSLREGDSTRDPEEERRLFYVAVTRARTRLFLSYAHERLKYGERERTLPSEFIDDIDARLVVRSRPKRNLLDDVFID
jgi:DNA helicase-2/ATP-dependent DNA helicase PcrA